MIDDTDLTYKRKRTHEKKVIAASLLGIAIVLFGAYRLTAVERTRGTAVAVSTDTETPVSIVLTPNSGVDVLEGNSAFFTPEPKSTATATATAATATTATTEPKVIRPRAMPPATYEMIPAGTMVNAKLATHVSSRDANVGDRVVAVTIKDVAVHGRVVIPVGTTVTGQVIEAGPAFLRISFSQIGSYRAGLGLVSPDLDQRVAAEIGNVTAYEYRPENVRMNAGERIELRLSENVRL